MSERIKAIMIPEELYKLLEERAKIEGKNADKFVEDVLKRIVI
jgi:hypothetical protein